MNKKLIVLILVIFMLLSVVVIGLFGAQPAPPTPRVEEVSFVGENNEIITKVDINIKEIEKNEDGKYVINYQLKYIIIPENAVDKRLEFKVYTDGNNDIYNDLVDISPDGYITITLDSLIPISIPIIARCVDKSADFYGKTAIININLITSTGGHIGGL